MIAFSFLSGELVWGWGGDMEWRWCPSTTRNEHSSHSIHPFRLWSSASMGKDSFPRSDLITIRWAKLEALEGSHVCSADSPTSFHGDYAGIRIPDPFKSNSKLCNSLVSMASLSSIFWRKKDSRTPHPSSSFASVSFTPIRGTYAYDLLQSRFKITPLWNEWRVFVRVGTKKCICNCLLDPPKFHKFPVGNHLKRTNIL